MEDRVKVVSDEIKNIIRDNNRKLENMTLPSDNVSLILHYIERDSTVSNIDKILLVIETVQEDRTLIYSIATFLTPDNYVFSYTDSEFRTFEDDIKQIKELSDEKTVYMNNCESVFSVLPNEVKESALVNIEKKSVSNLSVPSIISLFKIKDKYSIQKTKKVRNYSIDKKIKKFINWYFINYVKEYLIYNNEILNNKGIQKITDWYYKKRFKEYLTDIPEVLNVKRMRKLIEITTEWYELNYPDNEVTKRYLVEYCDDESVDIETTNMVDCRNPLFIEKYIDSLDLAEKRILSTPKFANSIYLNNYDHLHLTPEGIVDDGEIVVSIGTTVSSAVGEYLDFNGWYIEDVFNYLKEINYPIKRDDISKSIKNYKKRCELRSNFLDMVMYRIIQKGGNIIGPRRALLFALDFNINPDIPMIYGVDYSDPELREFINQYIKAGGHTELECLVNYDLRNSDKQPLNTVTVLDMIKTVGVNCAEKYTKEESLLHQRLVNALSNKIKIEEVGDRKLIDDSKQIEQKRLIRKL